MNLLTKWRFRVVKDRETGASKGYAFCEYVNHESALAAINCLDQQELFGRRIKVDSAHNKDANGRTKVMTGPDALENGRVSPETKKEVDKALRKLSTGELYDVVSEMKMLIQRDKEHATNLLKSKPVLAHALLTAQIMLGMAQYTNDGATASALSESQGHAMDQDEDMEEDDIVKQVLALTDEQIAGLPADERDRLLQIRRQYNGA